MTKTLQCLGVLLIAVFGAYFNALGNGLVDFDDAVVTHPQGAFGVSAVQRLATAVREEPLKALSDLLVARPLTGLSHMLDVALFGRDDYWGHHLGNVAYHFLACCFAFLAAAQLLGSKSGALAAALVFALHPLQTESVAYLAGRRDVLCGLLSLASLCLWLRGLRAGAVALWALAMAAKPAAAAMPLLWLAAAAARDPGERKERLPRDLALCLACAAASAAAALAHLQLEAAQARNLKLPAELFWYGGNVVSQWATEPRILAHALKLLLWPVRLSADYSLQVFEPSRSFLDMRTLLSLAACAAALWPAWALRKRRPMAGFALAWIFLTYAPMLHLLPALHNSEVFAEHWLYLPLFGFALLLGSLREDLQRFPKASWAALGLLLCLYAGRTVLRNRDWKDATTLWSRTVETYPRCGRAHGILGMVHLQKGELAAAEAALLRALELRPDDPKNRMNLAAVYNNTGRFQDAERALLQARALPMAALLQDDINHGLSATYLMSGQLQKAGRLLDPDKILNPPPGDHPLGKNSVRSLELAGMIVQAQGEREMAEKIHVRALSISRDPASALYSLGLLYFAQRNFELAAHDFERLLKRKPAHLMARVYLGLSYAEAGEIARAQLALEQALKAAPGSADVWLAVSKLQLKRKRLHHALAAARQAARLEKSPRTDRQLYAVYREM
ncbi:MAG: tetratricopeptide repeat protein [Elusimicrobia bacterium]|nr:tetratricopeptide repeat protein [Elusimicrobiota bacterium]